jgi:hypothetical protein
MIVGTDPAKPVIDEPRKLIGVTPALAAYGRRRLLGVPQKAFPVKFEARAPTDLAGLDGLLVFASDDSQDGPQLQERSTHVARHCWLSRSPEKSPIEKAWSSSSAQTSGSHDRSGNAS